MNLLTSPEQEQLAGVLDRACRLDDPAARERAVRDVGLFDAGGLGGADDEAVAFRVLGRHLAPVTWLTTALATWWTIYEDSPSGLVALAERHRPGTWRVLGGRNAVAVLEVGPDEARFVACPDLATAEPGFDPGTDITLLPDAVLAQAEVLGEVVASPPFVRWGSVLVAAMLAGSAEASLQRSVAHVKEREQFGRPIGAFQAVAHRCADMAIRTEAAIAAVHLAAVSVGSAGEESTATVAAARLVAADAALRNAAEDIQNHGALGFTADMDCHRHLKRAHLLERTLGTPEDHVATLVSGGSAARTRPG